MQGMLPDWPNHVELRDWQQKALYKYFGDNKPDWLLVATPGAGKTTFSLKIAHELLRNRMAERIVVVVPSDNLCQQWARQANRYGINLNPNWKNSAYDDMRHNVPLLAEDFHGVVVTYQQISSNPVATQALVRQRSTFAIIDEVHHAGDENTWGSSLQEALSPAVRRLAVSGTPFRSDNSAIPFVTYEDNKSVSDFYYDYGRALRDNVCRLIYFPTYEGEMEWLSSTGEIMIATFEDQLNQNLSRERLRTAINAGADWLKDVISKADLKLLDIQRNSQSDAKGLIVCKDKAHVRGKDEALGIAKIVEQITGEKPDVALSDDPNASSVIENFHKSSKRWLVAVKMVSEGVDIPNLRVAVYATNVLSELYFRQFAGRVVRMQPGIEEQDAYIYLPRDPQLLAYAAAIKEERDHYLFEEDDITISPPDTDEGKDEIQEQISMFMPISAIANEHNIMDVDANEYTPALLQQCANIAAILNVPTSAENIARILQYAENDGVIGHIRQGVKFPDNEPEPLWEQRENLSKKVNKLVGHYAAITGSEYKTLHYEWIKKGGNRQEVASLDELKQKQQWIIDKINEVKNARRK